MSPLPDTDVAILGAGLAGLSIATWLAETGVATAAALPRVQLIEARDHDVNDHTWCFWDQQPHPFREAICHRWPRWRLQHGDRQVERQAPDACYAMLTADALRRVAYEKMQPLPSFERHYGTQVQSITPADEYLSLETTRGSLNARLVIDTRPPSRAMLDENAGVWQTFHGVEIQVDKHDVDLSTATLMDFQSAPEAINFIYLLPLTAQRLLIEWTCFHRDVEDPACRSLLSPDHTPPALQRWLNARFTQWTVLRHETGCLPMMPVHPPQLDPRYLAAGVRGGWMRPATGYSFESCQRGAQAVAAQLLQATATQRWQLSAPVLRPPVLAWMDRVFLTAIRKHPERAPEWFMRLFERTSAAQQRRFMGDIPRYTDMLAIMRALPPGPFMAAALAMGRSSNRR